jgi:hypothetical protein
VTSNSSRHLYVRDYLPCPLTREGDAQLTRLPKELPLLHGELLFTLSISSQSAELRTSNLFQTATISYLSGCRGFNSLSTGLHSSTAAGPMISFHQQCITRWVCNPTGEIRHGLPGTAVMRMRGCQSAAAAPHSTWIRCHRIADSWEDNNSIIIAGGE